MTPDDAHARLDGIRRVVNDPEEAHSRQDDLLIGALAAIAQGEVDDPAVVAAIALKAIEIDFPRWYA